MSEFYITVVDILVVLAILVSAFYAAWRGLMRETLSIFSWAVAAYVTLRFFPTFRPMLREVVQPEWLADLGVFCGLFVLVLVPLSFLAFRFSETVKKTEIGPVDRALGFIFGVGRGLVVVGLSYIVFAALVPLQNHPAWLTGARLFPLIQNTSDVLLTLVPEAEELPAVGTIVAPPPAPAPQQTEDTQTYGAEDRAALDRLIETTGGP